MHTLSFNLNFRDLFIVILYSISLTLAHCQIQTIECKLTLFGIVLVKLDIRALIVQNQIKHRLCPLSGS